MLYLFVNVEAQFTCRCTYVHADMETKLLLNLVKQILIDCHFPESGLLQEDRRRLQDGDQVGEVRRDRVRGEVHGRRTDHGELL
jgi:hypothetical protein